MGKLYSDEVTNFSLITFYFSYNNISQLCELAYLTFLEEPNIGYKAKTFHIEVDEIEKLPMYCRGDNEI